MKFFIASKSSCPSPDDDPQKFEGADKIFVVTITGTLSGSNNSAQVAKKIFEEHLMPRFMSLIVFSAGGEVDLLVTKLTNSSGKISALMKLLKSLVAIKRKPSFFVLAKVDNPGQNGRLSKLLGTACHYQYPYTVAKPDWCR